MNTGKKKGEIYKEKALSYIQRVISGEREAGELERLAVERHLRDLECATEKGIFFDENAAKKALSFCQFIVHFEGEWAGQEFIPEDWQCFILWSIFGWKTKGGIRRFRYATVEVARKNGKTFLAAVVALLMLIVDGENGAQVYSAAVDKDQAKICWNAAKNMANNSPSIRKKIQSFASSIVYEKTASSYKVLSKETKNKDGFSPHCAICDEMHAWPSDDIYNLITSGMGARRQPLVFTITTAGFNMDSPYYRMRTHYVNILKGVVTEENTFCIIYCPDKDDDWKDVSTWKKASPNFGISVYEDFMRIEFERAMNMGGTTEVNFKTKNLNLWVDAPDVWIQDEKVAKCSHGMTDADLLGGECWGGLDLASHVDINALALYFPYLKHPTFKFYFWIPYEKIIQKEDRVDYREWKEKGWINVTPGNVIDIDVMVSDLTQIFSLYDVKRVSFDPAKAYHGVIQGLQKSGFDEILDEFSQGIQNISEPTKKLEADITSGVVDLMGNPVIRWMFRNVAVYKDVNDNIKLDKRRSMEKIDGIVAMADAYGGFMSETGDEVYKYDGGIGYVNF